MKEIAMSKMIAVGQIVDMDSPAYKAGLENAMSRNQRRQFSSNLKRLGLSSLFFQADAGCISLENNRKLDAFVPVSVAKAFAAGERVRVELTPSKNGVTGQGFLVKEKLAL